MSNEQEQARPLPPPVAGAGSVRADASDEVFISYSSHDLQAARDVRAVLEAHGHRTWMAPDNISGPMSWVDQILAAVKSCPIMVVLVSEHSNRSQHVAREVGIAVETGTRVIPVRLADVSLSGSLRYFLHLAQWVDVFPPPVRAHTLELARSVADADVVTVEPVPPVPPPVPWWRRPQLIVPIVVAALAVGVLAAFTLRSGPPNGPPGTSSASSPTTVDGTTAGGDGTAAGGDGTTATTAGAKDPLLAIPAALVGMEDLQPHLVEVAEAYGLGAGEPLELVRQRGDVGSIEFSAPETWADIASAPLLNGANEKVGDMLSASTEESRFYKYEVGGLFVGAGVQTNYGGKSLDQVRSEQQYLDLGCSSSRLLTVQDPVPGELRVWSDCRAGNQLFVIGLLRGGDVTVDVFGLATNIAEAEALGAALTTIDVTPALISTQSEVLTDSTGAVSVSVPVGWSGSTSDWAPSLTVGTETVEAAGVQLALLSSDAAVVGTTAGEWIRVSGSKALAAAFGDDPGDAFMRIPEVLAQVSNRAAINGLCDSRGSFQIPTSDQIAFQGLAEHYEGIGDAWVGCEIEGEGKVGRWIEALVISHESGTVLFVEMLLRDDEAAMTRASQVLASLRVDD